MTRVDGVANGCPRSQGLAVSECPRTNLAVPHPETVSVCLRGQASVCMGHRTRTPVAGHDMTNRISTPHNTQEHIRACLYLNKFREKEREKSSPRHTTCAANMPIRFNSPQEFRARHSKTCPSSSLPSSRSNEHDGVAIFLRNISRHGTITDFSLRSWSNWSFFRNRNLV